MSYVCRLCLSSSQDCVSLFDNNGIEMVESLTSIKIQKDDNLPSEACTECWQNINLAYRIQQDIIECDKKLRLTGYSETVLNNKQIINLKSENTTNESNNLLEKLPNIENVVIKNEFIDSNDEDSDFLDIISFTPFAAKCSVCGDELGQDEMAEHVRKHYNQPQMCEVCNVKFENIIVLQNHQIKEHNVDNQQIFECNECGCRFKYELFYKIHLEKIHELSDKSESDSGKKINNKSMAKTSKEKVLKAFKCNLCNATYSTKKGLENHGLTAHGISAALKSEPKMRECPVCHQEFTTRKYWDHMRSHSGTVICHICGVLLKHISLRNHVKQLHCSTITYNCPHCEKRFKNKEYLDAHSKKYHTGEIPYVCDVCGKGFYRRGNLNEHHRTTHLKLRPHPCQYCDKSFFTKFLLRNHLRQHTNDTPYRCEQCGQAFKHNVSLKTHKKSKHNIEEEKKVSCKICGKAFASDMAVSCHMKKHKQEII